MISEFDFGDRLECYEAPKRQQLSDWGFRSLAPKYRPSMEGREPPHIHVAHAGRYAKFWLDPVLVADVRGFRANEMTDIRKMVVENAQFFLEKWYDYFDGEN